MKRIILTTAAICAALLLASGANATTYYFYTAGGSGDYNVAGNWFTDSCSIHTSAGQVPGANDHAVICSDQTCNVTASASAATVEVYGTLNIQASQTLSLGSGASVVDGTVVLAGSSSTLSLTSSHIIVGGGSIDGRSDSAVIGIATGQTLVNVAVIEGNCQIVPVGGASTIFTNYGTVHANNDGTLYVAPDSIGVSSGIWQVSSDDGAVLQIGATSAGAHTGSVNVSNGTLDIDYDFETEGQLTLSGGTIDVASTKTFEAS